MESLSGALPQVLPCSQARPAWRDGHYGIGVPISASTSALALNIFNNPRFTSNEFQAAANGKEIGKHSSIICICGHHLVTFLKLLSPFFCSFGATFLSLLAKLLLLDSFCVRETYAWEDSYCSWAGRSICASSVLASRASVLSPGSRDSNL